MAMMMMMAVILSFNSNNSQYYFVYSYSILLLLLLLSLPILSLSLSLSIIINNNNKIDPPASSSSTKLLSFRPYDPIQDLSTLQEICKDVYGGTDYLPDIAIDLYNDPKSTFMVLTKSTKTTTTTIDDNNNKDDIDDDSNKQQQQQEEEQDEDVNNGVVVAVANMKKISTKIQWIEAVRICPNHQRQGLAKQLLQELIDHTTTSTNSSEIWSSTIESNVAMQSVFRNVGLKPLHYIHQVKFSELAKLPGWSSSSSSDSSSSTVSSSSVVVENKPKPFVQSLKLRPYICNEAKHLRWESISSIEELRDTLSLIKKQGGIIGQIPGLYKILSDETILKSLKAGLVYKLQQQKKQQQQLYYDNDDVAAAVDNDNDNDPTPPVPLPLPTTAAADDDDDDDATNSAAASEDDGAAGIIAGEAIVVFSFDNQIQSLQSQQVCSIVATTILAMESALWYFGGGRRGGSDDYYGDCLDDDDDDDDNDDENHNGAAPLASSSSSSSRIFTIAVDGAVPIEKSSLFQKIPFEGEDRRCILYRKEITR